MKRSAVYLVALSLLGSAAAFAAADPYKAREAHQKLNPVLADYGRHDRGDRGDRRDDNRGSQDRRDRGNDRHDWNNERHDNDRRDWDRNRHDYDRRDRDHDRQDWNRHDHRGDQGRNNGGWDRYRNDWNNHPNYWDNRRHDRVDSARYRFHYGYYNRPSGYYYRDWHRGDRLPRSWYGSSYIVYDWRPYRLYAPPYGYHWVRVGDDVILTALATGIVLDVIHDIWY
jgi:Ni/Co efflux regulator RcnB